jgi:hypothetical protein
MQFRVQLLMQFSAQLDAFPGQKRRVLAGDTGHTSKHCANTAERRFVTGSAQLSDTDVWGA